MFGFGCDAQGVSACLHDASDDFDEVGLRCDEEGVCQVSGCVGGEGQQWACVGVLLVGVGGECDEVGCGL